MVEIGTYLKEERQKRGISLEEIRDITKIRIKYLTDIENGFFDEIPGEVYVRGFLRSYAEALGLDSAALLTRYHELQRERSGMAAVVEQTNGQLHEAVRSSNSVSDTANAKIPRPILDFRAEVIGKLPPYALWIVVIVVVALGLSITVYKSVFDSVADNKGKNGAAVSTAADEQPNINDRDDSYYLGIEVVTEGVTRSWIRVVGDGEKLFEGMIKKDEKRTWKAGSKIEITYADAGGVRVYKNGEFLGRAGTNGKFVTIVYQADKPLVEIPVDKATRELPAKSEIQHDKPARKSEPVESAIVEVKKIEVKGSNPATPEPVKVEEDSIPAEQEVKTHTQYQLSAGVVPVAEDIAPDNTGDNAASAVSSQIDTTGEIETDALTPESDIQADVNAGSIP